MVRDPGQGHSGNGQHPESKKRGDKQPRASYPAWSPDLGFVPRGQPLPFREALHQLPRRYRFVLTKPGLEPFLAETGLGEWNIVWFQLLVYTVIAAGLAFLRTLFYGTQTGGSGTASGLSSPAVLNALSLGSSLGLLVLIPLLFFFAMGLLYWLARAFGGHGVFVQQAYTTLLFLAPCGVLVSVLGIIPFAGSFLSTFLGVILFTCCVVLQCFATVAVHQLTGGRATAVTILTILILIPAIVASLALWTFVLVAI